jgi:hypothetical protein
MTHYHTHLPTAVTNLRKCRCGDVRQATAQEAKVVAIKQVGVNAGSDWMRTGIETIRRVANRQPRLTTDDVWAELTSEPRERRAMGAAMTLAARAGIITPTSEYIPSKRVENHARPIRVWVRQV